ncbi:polysaccharide biosynthesis C-terminal domain-containing protein [Vibrio furnissii]|uniref:oligosaccharide flippase family protein n=1 Tax=Vibrio furnissii TaxID=29494 RepID=UPI000200D191|nr:polysaccharide biosynthesis C-terminal domain-containing protein [Vibrio furnissii]ADT85359.1 O-antigen flippase [Vibrio furnissii NCTC 11218]
MNLLKSSILITLEKYFSVLFISLSFFIFAKFVSIDELGTYSAVEAIVMICVLFSLLSLDTVFQDYYIKNQTRLDIKSFYFNCFLVKLLFSTFGYLVSIICAIALNFDIYISLVISLLVFFKSSSILTLYNITNKNESIYFIIGAFSTIISFILKVIVIYINYSTINPFFFVLDFFVLLSISLIYFFYNNSVSIKMDYIKEIISLVKMRFYFVLSSFSIVAYGKIDQVLIAKMMDLEDVANYAMSMKVVGIFILVSSAFNLSLSRELSKSKGKERQYKKNVKDLLFYTVLLGGVFCIVNYYLSPMIVEYIYGDKFGSAIDVIKWLSPLIFLIFISSSIGRILVVEELGKVAFLRNFFGLLISVFLNLILIPKYGLDGAVLSSITSWFFSSVIFIFVSSRMRELLIGALYVK